MYVLVMCVVFSLIWSSFSPFKIFFQISTLMLWIRCLKLKTLDHQQHNPYLRHNIHKWSKSKWLTCDSEDIVSVDKSIQSVRNYFHKKASRLLSSIWVKFRWACRMIIYCLNAINYQTYIFLLIRIFRFLRN